MKLLLGFVILIVPLMLTAHPHIFVGTDVTFVFDKEGLKGFQMKWVFDDMTSTLLMDDYDKNNNDKFDEEELTALKAYVDGKLRPFNYYCDITIEDKIYLTDGIQNFNATYNDLYVYYEFFLPCKVVSSTNYKQIKLAVYDKTYYSKFFLNHRDGILFENGEDYVWEFIIRKNDNKSFYYGQINPTEIVFKFKEKTDEE